MPLFTRSTYLRLLPALVCATTLCATACAVKAPVRQSKHSYTGAVISDTGPRDRTVRLVFVGDTGKPGPTVVAVRRAIAHEEKDYVVALGDLAYYGPPRCPEGEISEKDRALMESKVVSSLSGLGAPTLLALGNHDTGQWAWSPARQWCYQYYAAHYPDLVMPALSYMVEVGPVLLVVLNTNNLTKHDGERLAADLEALREKGDDRFLVVAGHHTFRTYHDKEQENFVRPWLYKHGIWPDLYANGHAHLHQFGVYDTIPALTTGSGSKLRKRPACNLEAGADKHCGPGQLWGVSEPGYAVVTVTPDHSVTVVFKNEYGQPLWRWVN